MIIECIRRYLSMKKSIFRLFYISALIVMATSDTSANDNCLIFGKVKSVSAPYNAYFENNEDSFVIKYQVEFENSGNATDVSEYDITLHDSFADTIEVYSGKKNYYAKPSCTSKLVGRYRYAQDEWNSFDDNFQLDCQNKNLLLTVQNPRDLHITMQLMSNNSIVQSETTHLMRKPADFYSVGQCLEPYNQCKEKMSGGIESVEVIEGPGLYRKDKNTYVLLVNPDETAHDKYKYKIAFKIKTSKKIPFYGLILFDRFSCPEFDAKILWLDRQGKLFRYLETKDWDSYNFNLKTDNEIIIFRNFSKKFVNRLLSFYIHRSNLPEINIYIIKDNRPQSCAKFLSDGQTLIPEEPLIQPQRIEQCLKTTTTRPSKLTTEISTTAFNIAASTTALNITTHNTVGNETGSVSFGSDGYKITPPIFSLLGVSLIFGVLGHY